MMTTWSTVWATSASRWLDTEHGAALGGEAPQEVAQPAHAGGVEAVGRLVEHEHRGVAEQGGGEREPLAHAEGEAADASAGGLGQPDQVEHLVDAAAVGCRRRAACDPQVVPRGAGRVGAGRRRARPRPSAAGRSQAA